MSEMSIIGGETVGARSGRTILSLVGAGDMLDIAGLGIRARGVHINTAGNIVGKLENDSADLTYTVVAGAEHHYRFKSITSATATGNVLF